MDFIDAFDFIVVGSGPSGVHAAQTLLEAGSSVLMLDVGITGESTALPESNFLDIRQQDEEQYKIWLGKNFEGLPFRNNTSGAQLTPSRSFVQSLVSELTPLHSKDFFPVESLAKGGLGAAWGLGSFVYSDKELKAAGLPVKEMNEAYQHVADRIGISAAEDEAKKYTTGHLQNVLPAIAIDSNARQIVSAYQKQKLKFESKGLYLTRSSLALLTENKDGRKANAYNNLDFYDNDDSAYRPQITIKNLERYPKFKYIDNVLVISFKEEDAAVRIEGLNIKSKELHTFFCRKLILACNVLGTARIVLRSLGLYNFSLPVLCNDYCYMPTIVRKRLGKEFDRNCTATAQVFLFHDPHHENFDVAVASLYSYSSLMMFRIAEQAPRGLRDARKLFKELMSSIVIAGVHMPDAPGQQKTIQLVKANNGFTGDVLEASYQLTSQEEEQFAKRRSIFSKALMKLGCIPLKKVHPGTGASIHYAGTLPYVGNDNQLFLLPSGRLINVRNVYIADGSGFSYLPAKGITLSLMANAHRTALNALRRE
jgi:hypothetical protein